MQEKKTKKLSELKTDELFFKDINEFVVINHSLNGILVAENKVNIKK